MTNINQSKVAVILGAFCMTNCTSPLVSLTQPQKIATIEISLTKPGQYSINANFYTKKSSDNNSKCLCGPYSITLVDSAIIDNEKVQNKLLDRFDENGKMYRGKATFSVRSNDSVIISKDTLGYQGNWGWYGGVPIESFNLPCNSGNKGALTFNINFSTIDTLLAIESGKRPKIIISKGGGK